MEWIETVEKGHEGEVALHVRVCGGKGEKVPQG